MLTYIETMLRANDSRNDRRETRRRLFDFYRQLFMLACIGRIAIKSGKPFSATEEICKVVTRQERQALWSDLNKVRNAA